MTTKRKKRRLTVDYKDFLFEELQDLNFAAGYLTAALEEGQDVFLVAIKDVAQAHGGMTKLSKETELNRENLYDIFSKDGNPRLSSIIPILDTLGFEVKFTAKLQGSKVA